MKTTVEIPEQLFRQAKARAALEGISLREFLMRGLRMALQSPSPENEPHRTAFPILKAAQSAPRLTDEQVAAALNNDDELT
jgi:hypothetical protein